MRLSLNAFLLAVAAFAVPSLPAAQDRIAGPIDSSRTVVLRGHVHSKAQSAFDRGDADPAMPVPYATLVLKPAAALESFLAEQQNPSSPNYHRWLTPEQFGDRFGASPNDVAKIKTWLESQGFQVHDVARGRHWITFSGTAAQAGRAFHTRIRRYLVNGQSHFANDSDISIPAALAAVIQGVSGLNDFGLQSALLKAENFSPANNVGSSHALVPDDLATIYNIKQLYDAGIDGTDQRIAIIGQTAINLTDIANFRKRFNLPASAPEVVLFGANPGITAADIDEANLDIEWAGAVARNATIVYVYSRSVDLSVQYAVDQNVAPVMTMSYGACELDASLALRGVAQQANAQGITWFVATGDWGATTCDYRAPTPQATKGLTIASPAAFPEVTAVGGTGFDDGNGAGFWRSTNDANGASALGYVPERSWNDTSIRPDLASTGGGVSALFPKPVWQSAPGVPDDKARDIPDISLPASPQHYPYVVYSQGGVGYIGGTSASSPAWAGIAALLNQYLVKSGAISQPGLGNINPMLYRLARSTTDVFHDITAGDNKVPCQQSTPGCINGLAGYNAGTGYDLATGLGTVDAYNLALRWGAGTGATITVSANPAAYSISDNVELTATVTAASGVTPPTGSVTCVTGDVTLATVSLSAADGASATAKTTVSGQLLAAGNSVLALYSGDPDFSPSSATVTLTFKPTGTGSFVVPSVSPNPVHQLGLTWPYTLTLTEKAGVATTITSFTVNGVNQGLTSFFPSANIPANGTVYALLAGSGLSTPINRVFAVTGRDAGTNATWSQQVTVPFLGPEVPVLAPSITLTAAPAAVSQNPQADPACQWSQQVTVQENGGYLVQLTSFTVSGTSYSSQIQQLFGTTRLAAYGVLRANMCFNSAGTKNYTISGTSPEAGSVTASMTATFGTAVVTPTAPSASPATLALTATDSSEPKSATVNLDFGGGQARWTATVSPTNGIADWLTVSPASGIGAAELTVQAKGTGLSLGAYNAVITIQSPNTVPQFLNIPVSFVVGQSSTTKITGLQNAFSFNNTFAPGMLMTVYGVQLSPSNGIATRIPLPLTLAGVSATVNGITAPLRYVSSTQLNIQIPYETGAGPAIVAVNNNGQIASFPFQVDVTAPGLSPSAINSTTGAPITTAKQGDIILLFMTGEGDVTPSLATGATPSSLITNPAQLPRARLAAPTATIGGATAKVLFAGIASGLVGVTQINLQIPADAPTGPQDIVISVGNVSTPPLNLSITQ